MKKLFNLLIIYSGAGLQFALLPLFVAIVGKEGFGSYIYFISIASWLMFFTTLGGQTKIRKILGGIEKTETEYNEIKSNVSLIFLSSIFCALGFFIVNTFIIKLDFEIVVLLIVYFMVASYYSIMNAFLIGLGRVLTASVNQILFTILPLCLFIIIDNIYPLVYSHRITLSILVSFVVLFIFKGVYQVYLKQIILVDKRELYKQFKSSLLISGNGVYDKLITQGDKVFVGMYWGVEVLAVYGLAFQLGSIVQLTVKAFAVYIEQDIFQNKKHPIHSLLTVIGINILASVSIYVFISYFFNLFFDDSFNESLNYLPSLLLLFSLRSVATIIFTLDITSGMHKRNIIIQYVCLFAALIYLFVQITHNTLLIATFMNALVIMAITGIVLNLLARKFCS